jgi:hypothetical protein
VRYDLDLIFCFVCEVIDVEMFGFVWFMDVGLSFSNLSFYTFLEFVCHYCLSVCIYL